MTSPSEIVDFWVKDTGPSGWYAVDPAFDDMLRARFGALHAQAADGELDGWAQTAEGALALLILLDQFSRNMFRGDARAFAQDAKARAVAEAAIEAGHDRGVAWPQRQFFYMPLMHAEDLAAQDRCVAIFRAAGEEGAGNIHHALIHRAVIAEFGRFPYRNAALGRDSTLQETLYMQAGRYAPAGFSANPQKTVLVFGDSLTWGLAPGVDRRHAPEDRWTSVAQARLPGVRFVESAICGRTTAYEFPPRQFRNGLSALPYVLEEASPVDLIVLELGVNDLFALPQGRAEDAAAGMRALIDECRNRRDVRDWRDAEILVIGPGAAVAVEGPLAQTEPISRHILDEIPRIGPLYEALAQEMGVHYFSIAGIAQASPVDGCHLEAAESRKLGVALAEPIGRILGVAPVKP